MIQHCLDKPCLHEGFDDSVVYIILLCERVALYLDGEEDLEGLNDRLTDGTT